MDTSLAIAALDRGLQRAIKAFGSQYFFVALEPERTYDDSDDDEDDAAQEETKLQLFHFDAARINAEVIQEIPAGMDSISCVDVAKVSDIGDRYYMSMAAYLDRQGNYYCVVYQTDDNSDPSGPQFRRVLSFKTDPDSERRQSCVRFDCSLGTENGVPKRLITATGNSIRVWDLPELLRRASADGEDPLEFPAPLLEMTATYIVDDVQLSPCGSVIAAIPSEFDAGQAPITLYDASSGQHVFTLTMPAQQEIEAIGLRFLPATSEDSVRFIVPFTNPPMAASNASVVTIGEMKKRTHECIMVNSELFPSEKIESFCVSVDASLVAVSTSVHHEDRSYLRVLDMSLRCVFDEDVRASEARILVDFVQRDTGSDRLAELLSISNELEDGIDDDVSTNRVRIRGIPLPRQGRSEVAARIHEFLTPTNVAVIVILAIGILLSFIFHSFR